MNNVLKIKIARIYEIRIINDIAYTDSQINPEHVFTNLKPCVEGDSNL